MQLCTRQFVRGAEEVLLSKLKILTILTLQYSVEIISNRETTLELEGETYIESPAQILQMLSSAAKSGSIECLKWSRTTGP